MLDSPCNVSLVLFSVSTKKRSDESPHFTLLYLEPVSTSQALAENDVISSRRGPAA